MSTRMMIFVLEIELRNKIRIYLYSWACRRYQVVVVQ
jgi:hypothetical protein